MTVAIAIAPPPGGLRERKKLETMGHVQLTALGLFEARGFDSVTIEEVARAALVSAPTIYRHFGTKEAIVLWDEYDPVIVRSLSERLRRDAPADAIREAIVRPLERIYATEASRILRRMQLVQAHAGLRAAVASSMRELRSEMARSFVASGACHDPLEAEVIAGAVVTTLEAAIEQWARAGGERPLGRFIERSLRLLQTFADTTKGATPRRRKKGAGR